MVKMLISFPVLTASSNVSTVLGSFFDIKTRNYCQKMNCKTITVEKINEKLRIIFGSELSQNLFQVSLRLHRIFDRRVIRFFSCFSSFFVFQIGA